jgi:hypothetical protein
MATGSDPVAAAPTRAATVPFVGSDGAAGDGGEVTSTTSKKGKNSSTTTAGAGAATTTTTGERRSTPPGLDGRGPHSVGECEADSGRQSDSSLVVVANDAVVRLSPGGLKGGPVFQSSALGSTASLAEKRKIEAELAIKTADLSQARVPNSYWKGGGFSRSMPESELRRIVKGTLRGAGGSGGSSSGSSSNSGGTGGGPGTGGGMATLNENSHSPPRKSPPPTSSGGTSQRLTDPASTDYGFAETRDHMRVGAALQLPPLPRASMMLPRLRCISVSVRVTSDE